MSNKFRYCLIILLLAEVALPWSTIAQGIISNAGSGSIDNRVTRLERIFNAHSQLLTHFQQLLADNQRDVDSLRGQIQENQYQLSSVVGRQKEIYQKIDILLSQVQISSQDSPPQESTFTTDVVNRRAESTVSTVIAGRGEANTDYNEAMALVLKKQYDQAISMFSNFVKNHPDSAYQPSANYWLGQLNYDQGKKDNALCYFTLVVKKYPKFPKALDALLKVGVIMQEKGQNDKARAIYRQVGKLYPSAEAAKQVQKMLVDL